MWSELTGADRSDRWVRPSKLSDTLGLGHHSRYPQRIQMRLSLAQLNPSDDISAKTNQMHTGAGTTRLDLGPTGAALFHLLPLMTHW